jgi:hypothetical protein
MSYPVDKLEIDQFRADRKLLPYDDIRIAAKMGVDRSNYSKAFNKGPITHAFLEKFYGAFRQELLIIRDSQKSENGSSNGTHSIYTSLTELMQQAIDGQEKTRIQNASLEQAIKNNSEALGNVAKAISRVALSNPTKVIARKKKFSK